MAHIVYRVGGKDPTGRSVRPREFKDSEAGRTAANDFKSSLREPWTSYEVRWRVDGRERCQTFARRKDADAFVTTTDAERLRGIVIDPRKARVTVKEYADSWLAKRHDLAERTVELYRYLLDKHILPAFGSSAIGSVAPSAVRAWHAEIAQRHRTTAAKAYRLLREILNTAVADEVIMRNPCQVKGAGQESAPERPMATLAEVQALADAMPEEERIAVLLAAWCQLRRGELLGLRRRDVDLLRGTVKVELTRTKTMGGAMIDKAPKTEAGRRTLYVPSHILPELERHIAGHVGPEPTALLLRGGNGSLRTAWDNARRTVGVSYRLHDLRHAGLTWSAATGASTAELMRRAGHASPAAALRYQHATEDRDKVLADALAGMAPKAPVVAIPRSVGRKARNASRGQRGERRSGNSREGRG